MSTYSPRSLQKRSQSYIDPHPKQEKIEDGGMDLLNLPPRSAVHTRKERREEDKSRSVRKHHNKMKNNTFHFPLVKILLILFFLLVVTVVTYPLWIVKLLS